MRVVTKPRVSESEKPVEKPKEEGEEVKTLVIVSHLVEGLKNSFGSITHLHAPAYALPFQKITVLLFHFQFKTTFRFSQLKTTGRKGLEKSLSRFPLR